MGWKPGNIWDWDVGPRDLSMWMPVILRAWGPGECGHVDMNVWKPEDLGNVGLWTCVYGDLRNWGPYNVASPIC